MLHDYGITFNEPDGWNTRFYRVTAPLRGGAILQAATMPLLDSDYSTYQAQTCAQMTSSDAMIIAMVFDPDPATSSWSKPRIDSLANFAFTPAHFTLLQGLPQDQIQARAVFICAGRICEAVACFGSNNPSGALMGRILSALRTLKISPDAGKEADGDAVEVQLAA